MASFHNIKGTTVPYFKIGKYGTTLYQGTADPSGSFTPEDGDFWFDTTDSKIKIRASSSWSLTSAEDNYIEKTTTYTASSRDVILANTLSAAFTITLPSSPTLGDKVTILDATGSFDTNNLTVGRNGEKIQGLESDKILSTENGSIELLYYNATYGWRISPVTSGSLAPVATSGDFNDLTNIPYTPIFITDAGSATIPISANSDIQRLQYIAEGNATVTLVSTIIQGDVYQMYVSKEATDGDELTIVNAFFTIKGKVSDVPVGTDLILSKGDIVTMQAISTSILEII